MTNQSQVEIANKVCTITLQALLSEELEKEAIKQVMTAVVVGAKQGAAHHRVEKKSSV
jgi:hypothetical protein